MFTCSSHKSLKSTFYLPCPNNNIICSVTTLLYHKGGFSDVGQLQWRQMNKLIILRKCYRLLQNNCISVNDFSNTTHSGQIQGQIITQLKSQNINEKRLKQS